jgi:hypothetical protein
MRRGLDRPSASRVPHTEAHEETQQPPTRTSRAQHEACTPTRDAIEPITFQPISARRKCQQQPPLLLPELLGDPNLGLLAVQSPSPGRKSPAYLQGKNPYGQILDHIEHPYREATSNATAPRPPAQAGTRSGSRLRTAGSFESLTRPASATPEQMYDASGQRPTRLPPKTVSVKAAKDFFNSKASPNPSAPPVRSTPTGRAFAKSVPSIQQSNMAPASRPTQIPSPSRPHAAQEQRAVDSAPPVEQPPPESSGRIGSDPCTFDDDIRMCTALKDSLIIQDEQPNLDDLHDHYDSTGRKTPNSFDAAPREAKPLGSERFAVGDSSTVVEASNIPLIAVEKTKRANESRNSDETVRRRVPHRSTSSAEIEEAAAPDGSETDQRNRRSKSDGNVRAAFQGRKQSTPARTRGRGTQGAPLTDEKISGRATKPSETYSSTSTVRQRVEGFAARGLSHDGASADPKFTSHEQVSTANVVLQAGYCDSEVLDDVDWRGGYGRRKTQDFGFPGARIVSRRTHQVSKPLEDPDDWIRRSCGHFSHMGVSEAPEQASRRPCGQCSTRAPPREEQPFTRRRVRDRTASSSSTSETREQMRDHSSRRRRHHSDCMPTDRCGDTFAKDLGRIIDVILTEHQNSLRGVIDNIKQREPSLSHLRQVSEDLIQRCQLGGICTNPTHTPCRTPCRRQHKACIPMYQSDIGECQARLPRVPPKSAEKLNVGAPGQIRPNVNDTFSNLRDAVLTVPDLVDLINSAADNLGVDLDRRPTVHDDEIFHHAPVERTPPGSVPSRHSNSLDATEAGNIAETDSNEDAWSRRTRRHLNQLSEERAQLMDELRSIAGELSIHPQMRATEPDEQALGTETSGLSRNSPRLRNESVDAAVEKVPGRIDQEPDDSRISRVLTRISTHSYRASELARAFQEHGEFPPEEVRTWLDMAQSELPAALGSITAVLDTLPPRKHDHHSGEPSPDEQVSDEQPSLGSVWDEQPRYDRDHEVQSQYGQVCDEQPQFGQVNQEQQQDVRMYQEQPHYDQVYHDQPRCDDVYEANAERPLEYDVETLPTRDSTEPVRELYDRIIDLERRLEESMRAASPQYSTSDHATPAERAITFRGQGSELPVQEDAEPEPEPEEDFQLRPVQRMSIRQRTVSPPRKYPLPQEVESDHSLSSEL